jgi:hypothetical protein
LIECAPFWREVAIASAAEFLGFWVGPEAHLHVWVKPFAKFANRVACIRRAGVGLSSSIVLFNTCAIPILSYVAQLFTPTVDLISQVEALSPRIIPAPGAWASHYVLSRIRVLLPFRQDLLDFKVYCLAIRCRIMFRQFTKWTCFDATSLLSEGIDNVLWFFQNPTVSLRATFVELVASGYLSTSGFV